MSDPASTRVFVTGLGPVTSIGVGVDALWRGLSEGRCAASPRQMHVDPGREEEFWVASMPPALPIIKPHHEFLERQDYAGYRDLAYALAAIDLAIDDAKLDYDPDTNRIGVIQSFEAPGMERAVATMFETCAMMSPSGPVPPMYELLAPYFYNCQGFLYVHVVGKAFKFHGFSTSVHNACSSGAYAIELAAQRIRSGETDTMFVTGGEAFDTGVRIEWFKRLGLYANDNHMNPFDGGSSGFYVGEGGCALVLESEEAVERRGVTPYAEYHGGAFAQQGWKHALPDVRANRLADVTSRMLELAEGTGVDVDLYMPHGASTFISDGYEASCLTSALKGHTTDAVAAVYKPHVGHMLATSTLVEVSAGLLAMRHGLLPATLNSKPDCSKLPIPLVTKSMSRDVRGMIKLSTGFTGHDAASLFSRVV